MQNTVSVYAVRPDGATGDLLGRGVLVEPGVVLADRDVAAARTVSLRVAIASSVSDPEVIDVGSVAPVDEAGAEVLFLVLAVDSAAPVTDLGLDKLAVLAPVSVTADPVITAELRSSLIGVALGALDRLPPAVVWPPDDPQAPPGISWMCRLFRIGCKKGSKLA